MFKIVLYNNSIIKSAFAGVKHIVDEIKIKIDHDGVYCDALDTSHVSFVHLELKETLFDEYEVEEPTSLIVDSEEFMKVLSRCKSTDILTLEADTSNLILTYEGDSTRQFRIKLIDTEYETPTPPNVKQTFTCEISTITFKDTLSDVEVFSEKLHLKHEDGNKYLHLSGDDNFGATNIKYLLEEEEYEGACNSVYSLDKLKDFMKSEKFSKHIRLKSGETLPLTLEFILPLEEGVLSYLLAPVIEQE